MKFIVLAFTMVAVSCATTDIKTTVTAPDGTVTVTESKITAPDAGSVAALTGVAGAFAPRAVVIHSGK